MRIQAAVLRQPGLPPPYAQSKPLEIAELDLSPPGRGEVLVQIKAAGLCHSDPSVIDGSRPRPTPMALGHEAAGIVEAVGDGVTDLVAGDHVVLVFVPSCGRCPLARRDAQRSASLRPKPTPPERCFRASGGFRSKLSRSTTFSASRLLPPTRWWRANRA